MVIEIVGDGQHLAGGDAARARRDQGAHARIGEPGDRDVVRTEVLGPPALGMLDPPNRQAAEQQQQRQGRDGRPAADRAGAGDPVADAPGHHQLQREQGRQRVARVQRTAAAEQQVGTEHDTDIGRRDQRQQPKRRARSAPHVVQHRPAERKQQHKPAHGRIAWAQVHEAVEQVLGPGEENATRSHRPLHPGGEVHGAIEVQDEHHQPGEKQQQRKAERREPLPQRQPAGAEQTAGRMSAYQPAVEGVHRQQQDE